MIEQTNVLLEQIGAALIQATPEGWSSIALEIGAAGSTTELEATAQVEGQEQPAQVLLGLDGQIACAELRKAMYKPGAGAWYRARLTINAEKELGADFDYETAPFDELDEASLDVLRDDQKRFPRDPANLRSWHPCARALPRVTVHWVRAETCTE